MIADVPDPVTTLLRYIQEEWSALPETARPWGVWIRRHQTLPEQAGDPTTRVEQVWFLDRSGIHPRDLWTYQRFYTVHEVQPWCQRMEWSEPSGVFGRVHQIGIASFAKYAQSNEWYLETIWGGLTAYGVRVVVEDSSVRVVRRLWVS